MKKKQRQTLCSVQFHLHDFMCSSPNYCVLQWNRIPSVRLATALEGIWEIFQIIELMCMLLIIVNIFFSTEKKQNLLNWRILLNVNILNHNIGEIRT